MHNTFGYNQKEWDKRRIKRKTSWRRDERDVSVKSHLFGLPREALVFMGEVPPYQHLMVVIAMAVIRGRRIVLP